VLGSAFGAVSGFFISAVVLSLATYSGCAAGFFIGRHMCRDQIKRWLSGYSMVDKLKDVVVSCDVQTLMLIRAAPCPPQIINYFFAVMGISWKSYWYSIVGIGPHILLHCLVGVSCAQLEDIISGNWHNSMSPMMMLFFGLFFGCMIVAMIKLIFNIKGKIDKIVADVEHKSKV